MLAHVDSENILFRDGILLQFQHMEMERNRHYFALILYMISAEVDPHQGY